MDTATGDIRAVEFTATGPVGGRAHSEEEFLRLDTVVPRMQALALTLLKMAGN